MCARPVGAGLVFDEPYNASRWLVPDDRDTSERLVGTKVVRLAGSDCECRAGMIHWNGLTLSQIDFKGREVLAPNEEMWGWYMQRKLAHWIIDPATDDISKVVVFGTKDDRYTEYPEKYGFMGRRAIAREAGWKGQIYEDRLKLRNPLRGQFRGKWMAFKSSKDLMSRWDEICEESGLRVKYAPSILMINRFIKSHDDFVKTYLSGSRGADPAGALGIARPDHVTDHEIYRMFSGKHRKLILDRSMFADDSLKIVKTGKEKNAWYNKNQVQRWLRVRNQN